ncbi:MAG: tRNA pseudouridine(55) synthase TruB [Rugosibacter sp.]|nr:tRNA pseudouridine(55) synthase TruB [Rugosibacter sp.]
MNAPRRPPRRRLDGVLLLDKSLGISSNYALQAARRLYNADKAGHTGTLDPLATGLLPLCFGEATKFSSALLDADKRYVATVQLGVTTDTADAEGVVLMRRPVITNRADLEQVLARFQGDIEQIPPMHSALKRDGKPLYAYAREGIVLERAPRHVHIYQIQLLEWEAEHFVFEVSCSKGTYVRTLAADIGEALGCGGHLIALRRTGIGVLDVTQAHTMTLLESLDNPARDALLLPPDALLPGLAMARLNADNAAKVRQGQAIRWIGEAGVRMRVYDEDNHFIGVCQMMADGWLQPQRLVSVAVQ